MSEGTYQVVATVMKYWFILLILFILYRTIREIVAEYKDMKRTQKDSYFATVGYLEVEDSTDKRLIGTLYPIRRDCYIGKGSFCDVRIKISELAKTECFLYKKGGKTFIKNIGSKYGIYVNGEELETEMEIKDGSIISLYGALLRLKMKGGVA